MELKVTDDRLIELSGGIVQGTSGSPIIQDGKIIGAVTHVFVDDPTGATASALMRCCNYCSILRSSGSTVPSMVTKQMLPPITFDTGSAINTPSVPIPKE